MSLDAYIKSRAAFVAVENELDVIMRNLNSVSETLKHRRHSLAFKGTPTKLPDDKPNQYRDEKDAADWPSAEQIMERLALWHSRRKQVNADWDALDKDQRAAMQPPPEAATGNPKRY